MVGGYLDHPMHPSLWPCRQHTWRRVQSTTCFVHCRQVPHTLLALKGAQRALERAFVDQLLGTMCSGVGQERLLMTADINGAALIVTTKRISGMHR
jgi:hypothetical protein